MTRALWVLVLIGAWIAAGCSSPDLRRGKAELDAGNVDQAEADLLPLAELGYADAKLQLARVYSKRSDPESQKKGIALYRELLKDDPRVAVPLAKMLIEGGTPQSLDQGQQMLQRAEAQGNEEAYVPLLALYSDYPARDPKGRAHKLIEKVSRLRTPDAEMATIKFYRRNAPDNEKYAAALIKRCEPAKDRVPECYVDLARYYRIAGKDDKLKQLCIAAVARTQEGGLTTQVLERLAWTLVNEDLPGKPLPEAAFPMLRVAAENSTLAQVRLARLLIEFPHLDPDMKPEELLLKADQQNYPEAALALGRLYLDGKLVAADPARAEKYFRKAAGTEPAAHYYLGRIYRRGYLGAPDPIRAAQHYLTAARNGYARADKELAILFSDNRGVRPNLPTAFVFASFAVQNQAPESQGLLSQIKAAMKPNQLQEGQRLLREEQTVRATMPQPERTALYTPASSPEESQP